jgi:UTP--glucose-1-phosphate uridylyltransferase
MLVKKAVILAAGLGTRFLPFSLYFPKELLPLGSKPALQLILEECEQAGIKEVAVVISKKKQLIRTFCRKYKTNMKISFAYQNVPKGLADAVYKAKSFCGKKPFIVILGDDIIIDENPTKSLIKKFQKTKSSCILTKKVPKSETKKYGILKINKKMQILDLIEKPYKNPPSQYAIVGRYLFTKDIFPAISKTKPGAKNELQLSDSMKILLKKQKIYALALKGKWLTIGDPENYARAQKEFMRL